MDQQPAARRGGLFDVFGGCGDFTLDDDRRLGPPIAIGGRGAVKIGGMVLARLVRHALMSSLASSYKGGGKRKKPARDAPFGRAESGRELGCDAGDMGALEARAFKFDRRRLAGTVGTGDGRGAVGRGALDFVKAELPGK
jgi:hypothetical protein